MKKKYIVEVLASATVKFTKVVEAENEEQAKSLFANDVLMCDNLPPIQQPDIEIAESPKVGHDFDLDAIHAEEDTTPEFDEDGNPL